MSSRLNLVKFRTYYAQRSRLCAGWGIEFRLLAYVSQIYR